MRSTHSLESAASSAVKVQVLAPTATSPSIRRTSGPIQPQLCDPGDGDLLAHVQRVEEAARSRRAGGILRLFSFIHSARTIHSPSAFLSLPCSSWICPLRFLPNADGSVLPIVSLLLGMIRRRAFSLGVAQLVKTKHVPAPNMAG